MIQKTFEIDEEYAKVIDNAINEYNIDFSQLVTELLLEWVGDTEVVKAYAKEPAPSLGSHYDKLIELGLLNNKDKD